VHARKLAPHCGNNHGYYPASAFELQVDNPHSASIYNVLNSQTKASLEDNRLDTGVMTTAHSSRLNFVVVNFTQAVYVDSVLLSGWENTVSFTQYLRLEFSNDDGLSWSVVSDNTDRTELRTFGSSTVLYLSTPIFGKLFRFRQQSQLQVGFSEMRFGCGVVRWHMAGSSEVQCYGHLCDVVMTR